VYDRDGVGPISSLDFMWWFAILNGCSSKAAVQAHGNDLSDSFAAMQLWHVWFCTRHFFRLASLRKQSASSMAAFGVDA
jgi:hypothetical protein